MKIESLLASESGGQYDEGDAKKNNNFDFWETEDLTVANWPKTKSVWE